MKPKKERSPWRWLLLIPIQLAITVVLFIAGGAIDLAIFSGGEGHGHGVPIFSVLLPILALAVTAIVIVVALTGLIVGLARRGKRRKREAAEEANGTGANAREEQNELQNDP